MSSKFSAKIGGVITIILIGFLSAAISRFVTIAEVKTDIAETLMLELSSDVDVLNCLQSDCASSDKARALLEGVVVNKLLLISGYRIPVESLGKGPLLGLFKIIKYQDQYGLHPVPEPISMHLSLSYLNQIRPLVAKANDNFSSGPLWENKNE